jgi:hypothetical protein
MSVPSRKNYICEEAMKVKELLDEQKVYANIENEIRSWVAERFNGVYDIEFHNTPTFDENGRRLPDCEIVQCVPIVAQTEETAQKIVWEVNEKIDAILQSHDEEIVLSERLTRIYKKHPNFKNKKVESVAELKKHPLFLRYLKELIILVPRGEKNAN